MIKFLRDQYGLAATEFALVAPVLLLLLMGGYEMGGFFLLHQKLEKIAYTVGDVTAQSTSTTAAQLNQTLEAAQAIAEPYDFLSDGVVIISSIYKETDTSDTIIRWQYTGGGALPRNSRLGAVNDVAELPNGLELNAKDNIIVAEVFYDYEGDMPNPMIDDGDLYKYAVYKPRLGDLLTAP